MKATGFCCYELGIFEASSERLLRPRWLVMCVRGIEFGIDGMVWGCKIRITRISSERMVRTSRKSGKGGRV